MYNDIIQRYAQERHLSQQDAAQIFLQVVVLRHLSDPRAVFMGGTALVFGYENPRFSEDVDLTHVTDQDALRPGLIKARAEIEHWFGAKTTLQAPKSNGRTWRIVVRFNRAESLNLHVDSQPNRAHTTRPIVVAYPAMQPIVVQTLSLQEIMAEKILAIAGRRYLAGRDLFDVWFHWLRKEDWQYAWSVTRELLKKKMRERHLQLHDVCEQVAQRLSLHASLHRARQEWTRYLPPEFQRESVYEDIIHRCQDFGSMLA